MCTLSWLREDGGLARAAGYRLWFNRDERRERAAERPARESAQDGVRRLAPQDGESRGTWIAVNELGLTVALLNGYVARLAPPPARPRSRGLLIDDLACEPDLATLTERLEATDLGAYEPFVLFAIEPDRSSGGRAAAPAAAPPAERVWRWNGASLEASAGERPPLASSGFDQPRARAARRALYAELVGPRGTAAEVERFQRSHGDGDRALSPCMHRTDASTRSQVRIEVGPDRIALVHLPGPPCLRQAPLASLALERGARAGCGV